MNVKESTMRLSLFVVTLMAIVMLAFAPVFAMESEDGSTGGDDSTTSSEQETENETENEHETKKEFNEHVKARVLELRQEAKARVAAKRAEREEKTQAQRQKVCENVQNAVNRKLVAFNNSADKYLLRLDDVFTKLQDYQSANGVMVSGYDELVATATEQQTVATEAVQTLKDAGTTLDCTSSDPAAMLAAAKTAAADARDSLKDYRKSLKDIVVALAQAKDDATDDGTETTDGGTN